MANITYGIFPNDFNLFSGSTSELGRLSFCEASNRQFQVMEVFAFENKVTRFELLDKKLYFRREIVTTFSFLSVYNS